MRAGGAVPWFFSTHPERHVVLGGSVMGPALQILYYLGFSEVIMLGLDHDIVNVNGSGCSLGHPVAATGATATTTPQVDPARGFYNI